MDDIVDVLIYNAGIWESRGFTQDYDFKNDDVQEIYKVITVNLTSAISNIQRLLPNLKKSENAKIILNGSTGGLENTGNPQVSHVSSAINSKRIPVQDIVRLVKCVIRLSGVSCVKDISAEVGAVWNVT